MKEACISKRIGRTHLIIPDTQVHSGVPLDHFKWIGRYIAEKQPDALIQIGDFADMPSLNTHAKPGSAELEGQRYQADIEAAKQAMELLLKPVRKVKKYKPRMVLTLGNHEDRIDREVQAQPKFAGMFSTKDLGYEEAGWTVYPFLQVAKIDEIEYCHYFISGSMGRPVSSAAALLRTRHASAVMGHVQHTDIAFHRQSGHIGIQAGACYLHHEPYLNSQGNVHRRQIIMLHEVRNGTADPMFVSLEFLRANYS